MSRDPFRQIPADAAVVIPTILRPSLARAVRSVFAQDLDGRIQILIGIDAVKGDPGQLEALRRECPAHIALDVVDPGYSTARRNGGLHACGYGGALRTLMSFQANSRYIAYLDDDNWLAPDHLSSLRRAIVGQDWAYGRRWMVDPRNLHPICIDEWESVGPDRGMFAKSFGGFVDTNSLMIDKLACQKILPLWSQTLFANRIDGEDRAVFLGLRTEFRGQATDRATTFYVIGENDQLAEMRREHFRRHGYDWQAPPAPRPWDMAMPDEALAHSRLITGLLAAVRRLDREGDRLAALDLIERLLNVSPGDGRILKEMGRLCAAMGLVDDARTLLGSIGP